MKLHKFSIKGYVSTTVYEFLMLYLSLKLQYSLVISIGFIEILLADAVTYDTTDLIGKSTLYNE